MLNQILVPEMWWGAVLIFVLRLTDMSLDTLRVLFVLRGGKRSAWLFGFLQALVFIAAISSVLQGLENPLNILGYAAGFATGNVAGMVIEEKLALGHAHLRIISSRKGARVAEALREAGFAATEISGRGKDGTVTLINCNVLRKHVLKVNEIAWSVDEDAFVTMEDIRPLRRGFWRA